MKIIGVIPARYNSSRLPGKPMADINGKPMIQHVFERVKKSSLIKDVYIATDDVRIFKCALRFGGKVILTSKSHQSGTDRVAEAAEKIKADIIVNIQGDEPLIMPEMIDQAVKPFLEDNEINMSTLVKKITRTEELFNPNTAKVILDKDNNAIYFSRSPIPFVRDIEKFNITNFKKSGMLKKFVFYKHIGLYVYTKKFLLKIVNLPMSNYEKIEKLEQLRVLENGYKIKAVETTYDTLGVDTQFELNKVRNIMKKIKA
ncbi:MAG: 3-deoxy-manno-octulosonate cytidylyltransferase [Candidatus Firestonebacteria bacterium]|nr:3-deoxy-manno-octulosonate cytidylyltransferase [Candidatus Firestonebacteria bacterium]